MHELELSKLQRRVERLLRFVQFLHWELRLGVAIKLHYDWNGIWTQLPYENPKSNCKVKAMKYLHGQSIAWRRRDCGERSLPLPFYCKWPKFKYAKFTDGMWIRVHTRLILSRQHPPHSADFTDVQSPPTPAAFWTPNNLSSLYWTYRLPHL